MNDKAYSSSSKRLFLNPAKYCAMNMASAIVIASLPPLSCLTEAALRGFNCERGLFPARYCAMNMASAMLTFPSPLASPLMNCKLPDK